MLGVAEFERAVQRMAAISDAEQVADLCQATVDVLVAFDHWRSSAEWRNSPATARLIEVVGSVRDALAELPANPPLAAVLAAVTPLLNPWWPNDRGAAAEAVTAVEQLRKLAMTRSPAIADARNSVGRDARRSGPS
jgi:hypothetical protein